MKKWYIRILLFLIPILLAFYYYKFFGNDGITGVVCIFNKQTGWLCPGCGGQRAIQSLLHGNFNEAFLLNPLIYILLPLLVFLYVALIEVYVFGNKKFLEKYAIPNWFAYVLIILLMFFFIIRNLDKIY